MSILNDIADERSTLAIAIAFQGENGLPFTPTSAHWTLTDMDGSVLNSRLAVEISPAETSEIILSGEDLAILDQGNETELRAVTVSGIKDERPFNAQTLFKVRNLIAI